MKRLFLFTAAFTLSTYALAGNIHSDSDIKSTHGKIENSQAAGTILNNEEMKRLHKEMTRYGLSEIGMEARRQMIGTEEGRKYHSALKHREKIPRGKPRG